MSMRFSLDQSQKMEQKQVLSQRLIQSMELLQLPLQQLEERIEQELQTNPVLERQEDAAEEENGEEEAAEQPPVEREDEIHIREEGDNSDDFSTADEFAGLYSDTIDERPVRSQNWIDEAQSRHHDFEGNIAARNETLEDHLAAQLGWFDLSPKIRALCEKIICNLDRNGYLLFPPEELLGANPSDEERQNLREALSVVQRMEPKGVGAHDVKESLLLQLDPQCPDAEAARMLIENHLEDLEYNRLPQISKKTGFSMERIDAALGEIRRLNPRPGASFSERVAPAVLPDIYVDRDENGVWQARVDSGPDGSLCVSPHYLAMLKDKTTDRETKDYIRKNVGGAQWLIESIAQRKATLQKVAQAIVDYQSDFFEIGPERLRPLKMQRIADTVNIDVSTVSRTCSDKWLQSPQGIFPMKRFFSGSIASADESGDDLAKDTVKTLLRRLIDEEDKKNPLSDEELVKRMANSGVQLSRRTVAKYRDAMRIPSSRQRKSWK